MSVTITPSDQFSFNDYFRNEPVFGGYKVYLEKIPDFECIVEMEYQGIDENDEPIWGAPECSYEYSTASTYEEYSFYSREELTDEILKKRDSENPTEENDIEGPWIEGRAYRGKVLFCGYEVLLNLAKKIDNDKIITKKELMDALEEIEDGSY